MTRQIKRKRALVIFCDFKQVSIRVLYVDRLHFFTCADVS
jgi:hypothetical protein